MNSKSIRNSKKREIVFETEDKELSEIINLSSSEMERRYGMDSTTSSVSDDGRKRNTQQLNNKKHPLTVKQKSKIERFTKHKIERATRPSKLTVIFKWFSTILLGAIVLGCLTMSKVTIIGLSTRMTSGDELRNDKCFTMLLIVLLIPAAFGFIRSFWIGAFRKDIKWPSRRAIIKGVIFSIIETFGLCLFVLKILNSDKAALTLLLTNAVLIFPISEMLIRSMKNRESGRSKLVFGLAMLFEIIGVGVTGYLIVKDDFNVSKVWHILAGLVCISVSWLPWLLKQMVVPSEQSGDIEEEEDEEYDNSLGSSMRYTHGNGMSSGSSVTTSRGFSSTGYISGPGDGDEQPLGTATPVKPQSFQIKNSVIPLDNTAVSWKGTMIYSAVKIPAIFVFGAILYFVDSDKDATTAWDDFQNAWTWSLDTEAWYLITNSCCSIVAYVLALTACRTSMERGAFAVPLFLATPLAYILLTVEDSCSYFLGNDLVRSCYTNNNDLPFLLPAIFCLMMSHLLVASWIAFKSRTLILLSESKLIWLPAYNGVLLEQWLIVNRRNISIDEEPDDLREKASKTWVYICTTMYRETNDEMKQLLESISRINSAQSEGNRHFEAHVFFDGGVKDKNPTERVLQLVSLLKSTLGVEHIDVCTKTSTPYGLALSWKLPLPGENDRSSATGQRRMFFKIHLKDNRKVKNKKRWSQIMYMSYVLDFLSKQNVDQNGKRLADDAETFILTTDADVKFTPDSVEALLDLMTRDQTVGAVCARTHPLGMGPLVWYQTFEYAIGHWFQKAAEHVLGSVLCAPGCFSVYRCAAIRDILPTYASNVENAFDFLIKDMGEDRWFCTLMVQSGWRIEYCAASENSTNCPAEFEEFYKQRRRWIASTIANLMTILREWMYIKRFNNRVSMLFLLYQAILLFSTLIGPGTVTLIVSGGLVYAWGIDAVVTVILQFLSCFIYAAICLYGSESKQMLAGKIITFIYAMVMTAVAVGTAVQVAGDFSPVSNDTATSTALQSAIHIDFPVSVTTLYLGGLVGIFFVTALLHTREFFCLVHGIWYLLCLPSAYLVLIIYSICNITDRSWGTREEKEKSVVKNKNTWHESLKNVLKDIFFCCDKSDEKPQTSDKPETVNVREHTSSVSESPLNKSIRTSSATIPDSPRPADGKRASFDRSMSMDISDIDTVAKESVSAQQSEEEEEYIDAPDTAIPVEQWLEDELRGRYLQRFRQNGFESTLFISGMTEKELKFIGVKKTAHIRYLLEEIKKLPDFEIEASVPENVKTWLETIGLSQYLSNFMHNRINETKEMEVLKSFSKTDIEKELGIVKVGHIKRLKYAISKLRNPTEEETIAIAVKKELEFATTHNLRKVNTEEYEFWEALKKQCLQPYSTVFGHEEELKKKLGGLRNQWLMILACTNSLWIILIVTLAAQADLTVIGSNPIGLSFLVIYGSIFGLQFLSMFVHRFETLAHFLARAPYRFDQAYNTSWAFRDIDMRSRTDDDIAAIRAVKEAERKARQRLKDEKFKKAQKYDDKQNEQRQSLLNSNHTNYAYQATDVV